MREIKFRIWDCDTGEYVREGWHIGHKIYANRDIQSPDPFGEILEQYTGLKDKNGREIYEGDIVKTDELGWVGKCIYNYDGFILIDNRGGFSSPSWKECVVIGNIHENSELLK